MNRLRACQGCNKVLMESDGRMCRNCATVWKIAYEHGKNGALRTDNLIFYGALITGLVVGFALGMLWR